MSFDIISTESDSTSTSTSTSTPITIYYKPIPFLDTPTVHEEISYRQKDLSLGPFHPSLGLVPLEATISRQIYSSQLHDLLRKFSTFALGFLEPPTTTDIPDADKRIDAFRDRWPHLLWYIYWAAADIWVERVFAPSPSQPYTLAEWYERRVLPSDDYNLEAWDETALYAQIMRTLREGHDRWQKFSYQWVLDIEYKEADEEFGKELRAFELDPTRQKPIPTLRVTSLPRTGRTVHGPEHVRYADYGLWSTFNGYPDPATEPTSPPVALNKSSSTSTLFSWLFNPSTTTNSSNLSTQSTFAQFSSLRTSIIDNNSILSHSSSSSFQPDNLKVSSLSLPKLSRIKEVIVNGLESNLKKLNLINHTEEEEIIQGEENSMQEPLLSGINTTSDSKEVEPGTLIHRRKFDFDEEEEVLKKYV